MGGSGGESQRIPTQSQRDHVGEVVGSVGEQCEAVAENPCDDSTMTNAAVNPKEMARRFVV